MVASSILFLAIAATGQQGFDPAKLVGTWEVVKGPPGTPPGSTLVFKRDGQFESRIKGTSNTFTGRYRVEGNSLMLDPPGFPATIQVLNADNIMIEGITGPAHYRRQRGGGERGSMPASGGAEKWAVVKGAGGSSVEMPGEPNAREGGQSIGPAGEFDYVRQAFEPFNSKVDFMFVTLESAKEIPEANAGKAIEQVRDDSADRVGSDRKLISEKTIRLGEMTGREFALKVNAPSIGPVNLLGRAFVKGNRVFLVMATSRSKNAAMPPEVNRFLDSFTLGEGTAKAATKGKRGGAKSPAGPVATWGEEVDPDGDVRIERKAGTLTMTIPGKAHVLAPERGIMNAPRVVRPVEGRFLASVQVDGEFRPARGSTVKGLSSRVAGGLIIWKDPENYLVFQHRATADDGDGADGAVLEEIVGGRKGVTIRQPAQDGPMFLRLENNRGKIHASYSADGKAWKHLKPVDADWASTTVRVGIVGVSTSPGPQTIMFDDLTIEK